MRYIDSSKVYVAKKTTYQLINLFKNASDESLLHAMGIIGKLAVTSKQRESVSSFKANLESHPLGLQVLRNFLSREMHPNYYENLVVNFFTQVLLGRGKRREILENEGFEPPMLLVISPTMRCNLHCYRCYAGNYKKEDDLPFQVVDRILTQAKEMGIHFIVFSGGEPFVWDGIWDIFEKHHDMVFQIYTNGTFLNDQNVDRLVELGNAVPAISVEGFKEETDARRGEGVYDKVVAAMSRLNERKAIFGFSATATRQNTDILCSDEFIDGMVERGCAVGWFFNYIPIGRAPNLELMPLPEQRDKLRQRVREYRYKKPIFVADFWNDGPLVGGCIAGGRSYLHINNNGDVEPCVFAHFAVDNIKEKSLKESLRSPLFEGIRSRQPYDDNLLRPCMIIDNPWVLREVVEENNAHPTHPGAESILSGDTASRLNKYAEEYKWLADTAWQTYTPDEIWIPKKSPGKSTVLV